jgi:glycosyltransferase involved in cell wall biosynthesis
MTAQEVKYQENGLLPVHYIMARCGPGGAELSVRHYINAFSPKRKLYAYSLRPSENTILDNSKIEYAGGRTEGWGYLLEYFQYCRSYRDDIFHLLNAGAIILLITLLARVRKPVYHIHGTIYWKKKYQKLYLKPAWWLCSWFEVKYVANSTYSAAIFQRQVSPINPKVIYNGFATSAFTTHRHQRKQLKKMAYIGRLNIGKNPELVIRLFERIAAEYPDLELLLAGEGRLRPMLEAQIDASPCSSRIKLLGFVEDIAAFYGSVDLAVFLSSYESFGNVVPEALLTGMPILASDIPVFGEIFNGESIFILGDPQDFSTVEQNFLKVIADFSLLARKAYTLSSYIESKFGIEQHLDQIQKIYDEHN